MAGFFCPFILKILLGPRKQRKSWSALAPRTSPPLEKPQPKKAIRLAFVK
jgi:hypothetical protein